MNKPKILLLDIETAPGTAYVWQLFDENVPLERLITPSRMLCWTAKWYEGCYYSRDERVGRKEMLQPLHDLLSEADAVVTYNGDRFDLPKINGEFVAVGLPPVPPVPSIDLFRTVKTLGYQSGKLQFVSKYLGIGEKAETGGFELWAEVMAGNERAWTKMMRYNKQDVALLEKLYTKLRPFIKSHPRLHAKRSCPACGSAAVQRRGVRRTMASTIERLNCQGCGSWFSGGRVGDA